MSEKHGTIRIKVGEGKWMVHEATDLTPEEEARLETLRAEAKVRGLAYRERVRARRAA